MRFQSLAGAWQFRQTGTEEWLSASVPGGVHTDLLALGRIPDPFVADNEKRVQWVAESDWEYRYRFTCAPDLLTADQILLVCDGLDTLAAVTLNGQELGRTDNMFRQYRWDVKALLRPIDNELLISFASPVGYITEKQHIRAMPGVSQAIPGGPYLRKAPCHFGWDWGPQLPPIGIWKDLRLEGYSNARLDEVHLRQIHADGQVTLESQVTIERWTDAPLTAEVRIIAPNGQVVSSSGAITATGEALISIPIDQPQLWWPNGYGDQPLYQVAVTLLENNTALDQRRYSIGLRTIELRQTEDQWGRSFVFVDQRRADLCQRFQLDSGRLVSDAHYGRTSGGPDPFSR